jgi:hypothetical protein
MLTTDQKLSLLHRAETSRTNQNTIVWTVVSIFAAANAVLVQSIVSAAVAFRWTVAFWVALAGLMGSIFSCALVIRAIRYLILQELTQRQLEKDLELRGSYRMRTPTTRLHLRVLGGSFSAKWTLGCFSVFSVLAWAVASVSLARMSWPDAPVLEMSIPVLLAIAAIVGCALSDSQTS